MTCRFTRFSG